MVVGSGEQDQWRRVLYFSSEIEINDISNCVFVFQSKRSWSPPISFSGEKILNFFVCSAIRACAFSMQFWEENSCPITRRVHHMFSRIMNLSHCLYRFLDGKKLATYRCFGQKIFWISCMGCIYLWHEFKNAILAII